MNAARASLSSAIRAVTSRCRAARRAASSLSRAETRAAAFSASAFAAAAHCGGGRWGVRVGVQRGVRRADAKAERANKRTQRGSTHTGRGHRQRARAGNRLRVAAAGIGQSAEQGAARAMVSRTPRIRSRWAKKAQARHSSNAARVVRRWKWPTAILDSAGGRTHGYTDGGEGLGQRVAMCVVRERGWECEKNRDREGRARLSLRFSPRAARTIARQRRQRSSWRILSVRFRDHRTRMLQNRRRAGRALCVSEIRRIAGAGARMANGARRMVRACVGGTASQGRRPFG